MTKKDLFVAIPTLREVSLYESGRQGIKTFVLRTNTLSTYLINGVIENFDRYAIPFIREDVEAKKQLTLERVFGNKNPIVIEIGFGNGEAFLKTAEQNKDINYLGFEVYLNGFASCLVSSAENGLNNVKVMRADVHDVLKNCITDNTISGFNIYFPDPWPKKKHHKRRIINKEFVELLSQKLLSGGKIHFATDIEDYAREALAIFSAFSSLTNKYETFATNNDGREHSVFEQKGIEAGRVIRDIVFIKK